MHNDLANYNLDKGERIASSVEEVFEGDAPDALPGTANATISARKPMTDITAADNLSFMPPPHELELRVRWPN